MPVVDITIGKRTFQLVCGEGQESHLQSLAADVSARVNLLAGSMGNSNDTLLLVMSSLMIQDELNELHRSGARARSGKGEGGEVTREQIDREIDEAVTEAVTAISEYVEAAAARIEAA